MDETNYNKRIEEIDFFISFIRDIYYSDKIECIKEIDSQFEKEELVKVLKSNTILMIYNLVESTICEIMNEYYDAINDSELCYEEFKEEIQKVWVDYHFNEDANTPAVKFKKWTKEIVDSITKKEAVALDNRKISLSGNAGYGTIEKLFKRHGIKFEDCREVQESRSPLENIRQKRNSLAHGEESFMMVGRDISISDLEGYITKIKSFFDYLLYSKNLNKRI
ncbi:MAE_28990/MAE_18760 family HEPN-like nuclease [uncultured Dubosiella sp.]|uniref:MAE_28990/MAE_18760 family HEPN-like nuclease n=1 Tax=uncultured Dubosiella sp. TaxID=1937011 RepID=UPI00273134E3|nr:MAE_28990/MAE_18760 family HEPN-like nuclease [uncultured Dubosiella sp.]